MTAPARQAAYTLVLRHRNGGTTEQSGLTLDEARSLTTRLLERRKAAAVTITDPDGNIVGYAEAAA